MAEVYHIGTVICKVVTMPPEAAQMMMKAVIFSKIINCSILVLEAWYTTEHGVTFGDPGSERLSAAAILPAQMIGAFKVRILMNMPAPIGFPQGWQSMPVSPFQPCYLRKEA